MLEKQGFSTAFRKLRRLRKMTQEDFSLVSSRTYISTLERELKSPTLEKVEALARALDVHPLTLLSMAYANGAGLENSKKLLEEVKEELERLLAEKDG